MPDSFRQFCPTFFLLTAWLAVAPSAANAQTSNDTLMRLLQILRDRGSISAEEYEELRRSATGPPVGETGRQAVPESLPTPAPAPPEATAAGDANAQAASGDKGTRASAGKWYERIGLRGYTQFRLTEVVSSDGSPLEVPADRSVAENESLMIRRGRFVLSGDISDRVALYAQTDFNGSTGAGDYSLQMRDLYADIALDAAKTFRIRVGQSKVPYGFVNLQSSQNRAALERPDALNSAVEGERDLGAYAMWAPAASRRMFRDLVSRGLKGSGDYGVIAVGAFGGQGLNRADQNGDLHWVARGSYPFQVGGRQIVELGLQAYTGKFVAPTQALTRDGLPVTPVRPAEGQTDQRVAASLVWYPQPFGVEAEWSVGRGPQLSSDQQRIDVSSVQGGYVQLGYRQTGTAGTWFPFSRWQYYDGGRKFARNAPHMRVNEVDFGLELAKWAELELTMVYTHTFERTRSSVFPYEAARRANRLGFQVQWNY